MLKRQERYAATDCWFKSHNKAYRIQSATLLTQSYSHLALQLLTFCSCPSECELFNFSFCAGTGSLSHRLFLRTVTNFNHCLNETVVKTKMLRLFCKNFLIFWCKLQYKQFLIKTKYINFLFFRDRSYFTIEVSRTVLQLYAVNQNSELSYFMLL